ncbi:aquaporin [Mycoplasma todarodis]|uniref:aquaporin n=1 Tax=Mycoplasma todarodis TaxID=1937191 RepID=UPI003B324044
MWNSAVFVAELLGTLFLVLGALSVVITSKSSAIKDLKGKSIFVAAGIGIALMLAIYVTLGYEANAHVAATGWVNPAATLAVCLATNSWDLALSGLVGQLTGALIGGFVFVIIAFMVKDLKTVITETLAFPEGENDILSMATMEFVGSSLFVGGIATVASFGVAANLTPAIVGLFITLVLLTIGSKYALVLNPAAFLMPMIAGLVLSRPSNGKAVAINVTVGIASCLAAAAMVGGIAYTSKLFQ